MNAPQARPAPTPYPNPATVSFAVMAARENAAMHKASGTSPRGGLLPRTPMDDATAKAAHNALSDHARKAAAAKRVAHAKTLLAKIGTDGATTEQIAAMYGRDRRWAGKLCLRLFEAGFVTRTIQHGGPRSQGFIYTAVKP